MKVDTNAEKLGHIYPWNNNIQLEFRQTNSGKDVIFHATMRISFTQAEFRLNSNILNKLSDFT